jgi:hypothetical protein
MRTGEVQFSVNPSIDSTVCETVFQMGCDLVSWAEIYVLEVESWKVVDDAFPADAFEREHYQVEFVSSPFRRRNYALFGFLADVRNYAHCEPLAKPRGLPSGCDVSGGCRVNEIDGLDDFHSHSWFLVSELLAFDYDRQFWNRRIHRGKDGAALAQEGEGVHQTYREFLGPAYMDTLESLKSLGEPEQVRVVFCFGD